MPRGTKGAPASICGRAAAMVGTETSDDIAAMKCLRLQAPRSYALRRASMLSVITSPFFLTRHQRVQIVIGNGFQLDREINCAYQSECGDHRLHERHCVSVHW